MSLLRALTGGLTLRGRCVLLAGLALLGTAFAVGVSDLLRVAVLLLALPVVSAVVVLRARHRITCDRYLEPARVQAGEPTEVHLALQNGGRRTTGALLMEDTLPYALGGRPRFVLDRLQAGEVRALNYQVRADLRGRFPIGPVSVRLTDPFGLVEVQRALGGSEDLVATPVVTPLGRLVLGGDRSGGGESSMAALSAGTSDITTREYRYGDDLRRVHWRSTARRGELMVRQEDSPRQEQATLLLDSRALAHQGEGQASSFEWAVSAVASIGVTLHRQGYTLHLATASARSLVPATVALPEPLLLGALAEVQTCDERTLMPLTTHVPLERLDGVIVAVLGAISPEDADAMARMSATGSKIAFVLDTATWGQGHRLSAAALGVLRHSGWRVVEVQRGTLLEAAWGRAGLHGPVHSAAQLSEDLAALR